MIEPLHYDEFIKSVAFGKREFETEIELIDLFESYICRYYKYVTELNDNYYDGGYTRYIYKVTFEGSNAIIYIENFSDACDYEDKCYTNVQLIRTQKTSNIYRQAFCNSLRKSIEHYIDYFEPEFMIEGVMKHIEYFGKPIVMNDE
jgi:hypothetical protein